MTAFRLIPVRQVEPQAWMTAAPTRAVMAALSDGAEPMALFVGGCVRNTLLGLPPGDIDIATRWTPPEVIERLLKAGLKAVPTGIAHGTVTAVAGGQPFEITTLRRDVETDGRRAVVAFTDDWREDGQRRDFTMNTLLADLSGNIYDPLDRGAIDAQAGRVIFVGEPAERIAEDYLRILRFFRFHAYYGRGEMDEAALAACRAAGPKIATLSRERVTQEMTRLITTTTPGWYLKVMFENNVLPDLPQTGFEPTILDRLALLQTRHERVSVPARFFVLGGLTGENRTVLGKFLVFSNDWKRQFEKISNAYDEALALTDLSEKSIKPLIYRHADAALQAVLLIIAAEKHSDDPIGLRALRDWRAPDFPINGDDAKDAGVAPGPEIGEALQRVRQWWIDAAFRPSREECLARLRGVSR